MDSVSSQKRRNGEDGAFLLWAHDGAMLSIDQPSQVDTAPYRMGRTWKLQPTGHIDSVTVSLSAGSQAEYLFLDRRATLRNPEVYALQETVEGRRFARIPVKGVMYATLASTRMHIESPVISDVFALHQNYPNPFGASTTIRFDLPEAVRTKLVIYDLLGRRVGTVIDEELPAGRHQRAFMPDGLASGVYFYTLEAGEHRDIGRMIYQR